MISILTFAVCWLCDFGSVFDSLGLGFLAIKKKSGHAHPTGWLQAVANAYATWPRGGVWHLGIQAVVPEFNQLISLAVDISSVPVCTVHG